jgi:hypothetical protein
MKANKDLKRYDRWTREEAKHFLNTYFDTYTYRTQHYCCERIADSLGRTIPATASEEWLKGEVLNIVDTNPKYFLEIVNHPQYDERIFVQEAVEAGAIIRKSDKRYTLDNGAELGELTDAINYLLNPDNQEVKLRIKAKIDLATKK